MKKKLYRKSFIATLPDGSKKKVVFSSTKSEKDAIRKRDAAKAQYLAGFMSFSGRTTVAEYAERFAAETKLSKDDQSRLRRLLVERIGGLRLEEVKPQHIRQCYAPLQGLSKSSIAKGCAMVKRFFDAAVSAEIIVKNPCSRVPRPEAKPFVKRRSMTEDEERRFLDAVRAKISHGEHTFVSAWLISYICGLRPGEVRALSPGEVVLDGDHPHVSVIAACKEKTRVIGPPKTKAGRREVPIPQQYVELLRPVVEGAGKYLFPSRDGGPIGHIKFTNLWKDFAANVPLPPDLDLYCLRHTYCTNLAYAGIPEVVAMAWMGHDDPNMIRAVYADAANQKLIRRSVELLNAGNTDGYT